MIRDARHLKFIHPRWPRGISGCRRLHANLNEVLDDIGWTHAPDSHGRRKVWNERRTFIGRFTVPEVWAILRADRRVRS